MGLWQVGFFVIPKASAKDDKFELDEEGSFDDAPYWNDQKVLLDFFKPIAKILPLEKSWSEKILLYGHQDSNRFEVFHENGIVESVSFRIDFTSNYESVLSELIEFFILNGLIVLDENLNVLPLNFEAIKSVIENSPQVKKYRTLSNQ